MKDRNYLEEKAREIRKHTIDCIAHLGVGHVGGSLSIADVLSVLYFDQMNVDPKNPQMPERDRFVLSKGHGGPAVYAALALKGYFDLEVLKTLNQPNTKLPSHTDKNLTVGVDMTTGSLGQGFSASVGMAKAVQLDNSDLYVYSIVGDGESQEGQIWEAAMFAGSNKLGHLISFTDYNKMQIDGTVDDINTIGPLEDKWEAFNWHVQSIDGHDVIAIQNAILEAKKVTDKPSMIVLNTIKGKGVHFSEGKLGSHNMPVTREMADEAMKELK